MTKPLAHRQLFSTLACSQLTKLKPIACRVRNRDLTPPQRPKNMPAPTLNVLTHIGTGAIVAHKNINLTILKHGCGPQRPSKVGYSQYAMNELISTWQILRFEIIGNLFQMTRRNKAYGQCVTFFDRELSLNGQPGCSWTNS